MLCVDKDCEKYFDLFTLTRYAPGSKRGKRTFLD